MLAFVLEARSGGGVRDESGRGSPGLGLVFEHRVVEAVLGGCERGQRNDAATEPGAGEASADRASLNGLFDEDVELRRGDLEVVSEARVTREQEVAEPAIAVRAGCAQNGAKIEDSCIFRHDVPGTRIPLHLVQAGIAQFVHSDAPSGGFTCGAPGGVGAVGEAALDAGVDHEDRQVVRERDWIDGQGATIEEEGMSFAARE